MYIYNGKKIVSFFVHFKQEVASTFTMRSMQRRYICIRLNCLSSRKSGECINSVFSSLSLTRKKSFRNKTMRKNGSQRLSQIKKVSECSLSSAEFKEARIINDAPKCSVSCSVHNRSFSRLWNRKWSRHWKPDLNSSRKLSAKNTHYLVRILCALCMCKVERKSRRKPYCCSNFTVCVLLCISAE